MPPVPMMRRRFFLADNPGAGFRSHRLVDAVALCLEGYGARIARAPFGTAAESAAAIAAAARSGSFDAIVAAGGDGTVRLAVKAALGTGVPIGVIPLGTGNVLAHESGLPSQPQAAADLLLHGEVSFVNAGRANGELFLLMVGIGFDGRIINALDHRLKRRFGKLAYVKPTLQALAHGADRLDVTLDGVSRHTASWAIVANASCYGGSFSLAPAASIMEPELVAVLFHGELRLQRLAQLVDLALGRLDRRAASAGSDVTTHVCRTALITGTEPMPTQLDGDAFGMTPIVIETAAAIVPMILPRARVDRA